MIALSTHSIFNSGLKPTIMTFDTTKAGSASDTLVLPLIASTISARVDWGDGSSNSYTTSGNKTHIYSASGVYTVKIIGSSVAIQFANTGDGLKLIGISQWGSTVWETMFQAFMGCDNVITSYTDIPNIAAGAKSFKAMCYNCFLWTSRINDWDYTGSTSYRQLAVGTKINESFANLPLISVTSGGDAMTSCLYDNSLLSSANVDATLIGWAAQAPNIPTSVSARIGSGVRTAASNAAVTLLTNAPYTWTITNP
jgi:hypothetical protein